MTSTLLEDVKVDIGLVSQALNNSNATGPYYSLENYRSATAILNAGAAAATKTTRIEFLQAQDANGTGSKAVTGKEKTITANEEMTELAVTLASVAAGEAITINDLTFTAHATTTTAANREFSVSGDDAADATTLASLINDATYGVEGITASVNSNVITLKASEPGETNVSASSAASTVTIGTTKHDTAIECSHWDSDAENGYTHVGIKVTSTANTAVSAALARSMPRG